jgi:hypothetical protein
MTEHQWELELSVVCPYDSIIWRGWAPQGAQPQALSRKKLPACLPPPPPKPPPPVPRVAPPAPPPVPARAAPVKKRAVPPRPPPAPAAPVHRPLDPLRLMHNLGVPLILPAPKRTARSRWTRHAPWLAVGVGLLVSAAFTIPPLVAHIQKAPAHTQVVRRPAAQAQATPAPAAPAVPDIPITIKVERPRPVATPLGREVTRRHAQTWRLAPSLVASIRDAKRAARARTRVRLRRRRPRRPRVSSRVDADALLAAGQQ